MIDKASDIILSSHPTLGDPMDIDDQVRAGIGAVVRRWGWPPKPVKIKMPLGYFRNCFVFANRDI